MDNYKFDSALGHFDRIHFPFPLKSNDTVDIEKLKIIILLRTEASNGN